MVSNESLYGKFLHTDITAGEDTFKIGTELNETIIQKLLEKNINNLLSKTNSISKGPYFYKQF